MSELTQSSAWKNLAAHHKVIEGMHMRELFRSDPGRFERFSLRFSSGSGNGILLDYSKNRINVETMTLLFRLAR